MYSILPEGTVHMYLDITGKGLGFQKITGCLCICMCGSMRDREFNRLCFKKSVCKVRNTLLNKIWAVQDL